MNFNFFKLQTKISFKNVGIAYNPKVESAFTYSQVIKDIFEAKKRCFEEVSKISFDKMYYRRDIGDDLISLSK